MMPTLRRTLFESRRSLTAMTVGIAAFFYLVFVSFASFAQEVAGLPGFFRDPPRVMVAFLGGSADFISPQGWIAIGMLHPVILALNTAAALGIAAGAVATEVERQSIEFVLTRPVSRTAFLASKATGAVIAVTIVHVAGLLSVLTARQFLEGVDVIEVHLLAATFAVSWMTFVAIAMVALLFSVGSTLRGRSLAASAFFVVGSYFVNFVSLLFDSTEKAGIISVFHYFQPGEIIVGGNFAGDAAVLISIAIASGAAAFIWFARRDITR